MERKSTLQSALLLLCLAGTAAAQATTTMTADANVPTIGNIDNAGNGPGTCSTTGTLPPGTTYTFNLAGSAAQCIFSGTPTTPGTYNFVGHWTVGSFSGTDAYTVTVNPQLVLSEPQFVPEAVVGQPYTLPIPASGGTQPYTYFIFIPGVRSAPKTAGGIPDPLPRIQQPPGLTLDQNTGILSGTPQSTGSYSFIPVVQDNAFTTNTCLGRNNFNCVVGPQMTITVLSPLSITTQSLPPGGAGQAYSSPAMTANGGTAPYSNWTASGLPLGLTMNLATGAISGTPAQFGSFQVKVNLADSSSPPQHATQSYTLAIAPPPLTIVTPALAAGQVGTAYSSTVSATGGIQPYIWKAVGLPSGLAINPASGVISGTPAGAGTSSVTVTVTDSSSPTAESVSRPYTLTVTAGISLSCIVNLGTTGTAYSSLCSASGGTQPYTFSASGLPTGLSIDPASGIISGTPTTGGSFPVTVGASDSSPQQLSTSRQFTFTILQGSITVACNPVAGTAGVAYSASCSASGGTAPYSWSASGLPPGLGINPGTGAITGTPSAAGSFPVTASATDSSASKQTGAQQFTLTIAPGVVQQTCNFGAATVNTAYAASCTASGGTPPYSWNASGLPPGLTMNQSSGAVSGTPTTVGAFPATITVTDSSTPRQNSAQQLTITVASGTLALVCTTAGGSVGAAYAGSCTASGGTPPYTLSAPGLPPGLAINPGTGAITGTPTTAGSYPVTATVTDSGTPAAQSASQQFTIVIQAGSLSIKCPTVQGKVGVAYSLACTAGGGTAPYHWTANGLPPGLQIGATSGLISGTPNAAGSFGAQVQVADSSRPAAQNAQLQFTIVIQAGQLTMACGTPPQATVGSAYSFGCTASGGATPYKWSAGGLPGGLAINQATGAISGTPSASGSSKVTATVNDSSATVQTATQQFTISVVPAPVTANITQTSGNSLPNQTNVTVAFGQAVANYTGQLSLSFTPDASVANVPAGYRDPSAGFPVAGSNTSSLSMPFTVAASSATQTSAPFAVGTVAGTWTVTLTQLNDPNGLSALSGGNPAATIKVAPSAPVIQAGSVQITQLTSAGFTVQLTASSNIRALSSATFVFTPSAGATLQGATVTVPFNGADQTSWFGTQASLPSGGNFTLKVPFALSGASSALGGVSVTLTNADGTSSAVGQ